MTEEQREDENNVGMCYQAERTCANCREWFINSIGERDCLQTHCSDYSDWVERPQSSEVADMTDEEIAEGYYNSKFKSNESHFSKFDIEQAFLAGLNAGRPKWHKVADGDLPKDENDVLVYSGEDWRMCVGRYSPKYKVWEVGCDTIAWCEIPQFKEKESMFRKEAEDCEEQPRYCHDCEKFDEMPKGPWCKTCDDGSRFLKKL